MVINKWSFWAETFPGPAASPGAKPVRRHSHGCREGVGLPPWAVKLSSPWAWEKSQDLPQSSVQKPTCSHSVFQGVPTIHQNLLQGLRVVWKLQVEALHALQELVWVVEVQHFGRSVKSLPHVIEEDVHNLQQKLHGLLLTILGGQQICGANQLSALALGERSRDEPASAAHSIPRTWKPWSQHCLVAAGQTPSPSHPAEKGKPRSPTATTEGPSKCLA